MLSAYMMQNEGSRRKVKKIKKEIEGVLSNRNPEMKMKIVTF